VTTILISLAAGVLTFAAGIAGLLLQKRLPGDHMSAGSRDMIGAVLGLVTLLLALVLGTLVGAAYGFYATQKSEVESLSARAIQFDAALAEYGPEALPLRAGVKAAISKAYSDIWVVGETDPDKLGVASFMPGMKAMDVAIGSLNPTTPLQRQLMSTIGISAGVIEQTRLLMSLQLASPISWPLLIVVVSWALLLFLGFGVLSRLNSTSVAALSLGAFAVASAIFLILELNSPYTGLLRLPGAPVEQAIAAMGK
jgi:hypothetical protein